MTNNDVIPSIETAHYVIFCLDIKVWTELPVAECVRTAQDRTAWRAKVSLALTFDPQEWGRTSPVQSTTAYRTISSIAYNSSHPRISHTLSLYPALRPAKHYHGASAYWHTILIWDVCLSVYPSARLSNTANIVETKTLWILATSKITRLMAKVKATRKGPE